MEDNIPKEVYILMEILETLQNPYKFKEAEKNIESASLEEIVPPLIKIITLDSSNPEELPPLKLNTVRQSASIILK
jgi:hypothetical protein